MSSHEFENEYFLQETHTRTHAYTNTHTHAYGFWKGYLLLFNSGRENHLLFPLSLCIQKCCVYKLFKTVFVKNLWPKDLLNTWKLFWLFISKTVTSILWILCFSETYLQKRETTSSKEITSQQIIVVYLDQLLVAAHTCKLVEIIFLIVFKCLFFFLHLFSSQTKKKKKGWSKCAFSVTP